LVNKYDKKIVINNLNRMFSDYEGLKDFCVFLNNDLNTIINMISKIIKYAFVNQNFIINSSTLSTILFDLKDEDKSYKAFLRRTNKGFFGLFKRKESVHKNFLIPLDDDIRLSDVDGLILPSMEYLKQICSENLLDQKEIAEDRKRKKQEYESQKGFSEVGFVYTRLEIVTIDSSFTYYHPQLTGNVNEDYYRMYHDERYKNKPSSLDNSYEDNINKIKKGNDIRLTKYGNVYDIENGRHRILYILKNGKLETIPVWVHRRIEDKEFNQILISLKKDYHIRVYKNNLLNDEPNILILLNNFVYEIKNKTDLKEFYDNLKQGKSNDNFFAIKFDELVCLDDEEQISKYKELIYKKYVELGDYILIGNFTDIINCFEGVNYAYLYMAFNLMQSEYQKSKVFNLDFKVVYAEKIKAARTNSSPLDSVGNSLKV